jgi:hypothetical protein
MKDEKKSNAHMAHAQESSETESSSDEEGLITVAGYVMETVDVGCDGDTDDGNFGVIQSEYQCAVVSESKEGLSAVNNRIDVVVEDFSVPQIEVHMPENLTQEERKYPSYPRVESCNARMTARGDRQAFFTDLPLQVERYPYGNHLIDNVCRAR